jgi:hypothetical protein
MRDFEREYNDFRRRMAFQETMKDLETNDTKLLSLLVYVGNNKFPSYQVDKMNKILNAMPIGKPMRIRDIQNVLKDYEYTHQSIKAIVRQFIGSYVIKRTEVWEEFPEPVIVDNHIYRGQEVAYFTRLK